MQLVLDATPLIYLTRVGFWTRFSALPHRLFTTPEVLAELRVAEFSFPETAALRAMLETKRLVIETTKRPRPPLPKLSDADAAAVHLALKKRAVLVADDQLARTYAGVLGVKVIHSTDLLEDAVYRKILTPQQAASLLDAMIAQGWHCDGISYARILQGIRETGKKQ